MTWAGRSRSRSLALPVSARTCRTSPSGNVPAITPRLIWSLTRMPAGRPARVRAIVAAHPRASASMAQLCPYVNGIDAKAHYGKGADPMCQRDDRDATGRFRTGPGAGPPADGEPGAQGRADRAEAGHEPRGGP